MGAESGKVDGLLRGHGVPVGPPTLLANSPLLTGPQQTDPPLTQCLSRWPCGGGGQLSCLLRGMQGELMGRPPLPGPMGG